MRPAIWTSLALTVAILVVYAQVRHFGFVNWDDPHYVTNNPQVLAGLSWHTVRWAFTTTTAAGLWLPLTWLSLMLDTTLWGPNAGGYHVTNVALHAANTLLLFGLLYRVTRAHGRSAAVAAFFALHPLQVESVAWVTERKDVLSTFFLLLTLWAYVTYVNRPAVLRYVIMTVTFVLGLMAKPMLVTLPFLLLLFDLWPLERVRLPRPASGRSAPPIDPGRHVGARRSLLEKLPLLLIAILTSTATFVAQKRAGAVSVLEALPLDDRVQTALRSYVAYIGKIFWPSNLAGFYPYTPPMPVLAAVCAVVLIALTVLALLAARRYPYVAVGWLWYLGSLLPVIGLIQVGIQMRADRFTYIPAIGLFIAVVWGAYDISTRWSRGRVALIAAGAIATAASAVSAYRQAGYWRDSLTFWQHTLEVTEDNARAHGTLGMALSDLGRIDEAIAQYTEALRIDPGLTDVHVNLANALAARGNTDEAIAHYRDALRLRPNNLSAHNGLGSVLDDQGKYAEAIVHYRDALRIDSGSADVHNNLAAALVNQGNLEEALPHLLEAVRLAPEEGDMYYNAAAVSERLGRLQEAERLAEETLRRRPDHADARALLQRIRASGRVAPPPMPPTRP
jgi:Flp pilus assembly protein TadD